MFFLEAQKSVEASEHAEEIQNGALVRWLPSSASVAINPPLPFLLGRLLSALSLAVAVSCQALHLCVCYQSSSLTRCVPVRPSRRAGLPGAGTPQKRQIAVSRWGSGWWWSGIGLDQMTLVSHVFTCLGLHACFIQWI
jgi:hypothetical protein